MTPYFAILALLSCVLIAHADVSQLGNNRFGQQTTRLQRQQQNREDPYPAAGFRPRRPFNIPAREERQFFQSNQNEESFSSTGLGANGESVLGQPSSANQRPNVLYAAPSRSREFNPAPQRAQASYAAAQRAYAQRQRFLAQQAAYAPPQRLYGTPIEEPPAERLTLSKTTQKSERLTDNREEREPDVEQVEDIEVGMSEEKASPATAAPAATTPQPATNVFYYPAGAVGFVHPLAAYVQATGAYYAQPAAVLAAAPVTTAAVANKGEKEKAEKEDSAAPSRVTEAAAPAVAAPATPTFAIAQPQYFSSPYLQKFAYAVPAQLQAW